MTKSSRNPILIVAAILILIAVAALVYVLRPTVAPSGELESVPIELSTSPADEVAAEATLEESASEADVAEPTEEAAPEQVTGVFEISQDGSSASFLIDEILRGEEVTVLGVTDQIAGQIFIDLGDPSMSQLGILQVNARTLETDQENRNRAMRNQILSVEEFELISFETQEILGLPESVEFGVSYLVELIGNLSIRFVTTEVSFEGTVILINESELQAEASAEISRSDYQLTIPSVPFVADVSDTVIIQIELLAFAQ